MAITVGKLFGNSTIMYNMKLIAGRKGLDNLVEWVHIIEDDDASKFLHGNEVILTAGILNSSEQWLLDFTQKLYSVGISAFIVNIGPHTGSVPREVIDYCNEVNMPLYTIPWETRMVDITRDICHRIIKSEEKEISISNILKNIIFNIGDIETHILQMERYGFSRDSNFSFIIMEYENQKNSDDVMNKIKLHSEKIARSIHELFIAFSYNGCWIMLLVNYGDYDIRNFVDIFTNRWNYTYGKIYMGISENKEGIKEQLENFNNGFIALKMAKKKERNAVFYESLDIYKLILGVNNNILREFYNKTIGKLDEYDKKENTELSEFLYEYLKNNGSQSLVAQKQYIHRNTVNNQLKKIEKITGLNPLDLEEKLRLYLAYFIKDIL